MDENRTVFIEYYEDLGEAILEVSNLSVDKENRIIMNRFYGEQAEGLWIYLTGMEDGNEIN